MKKISFTALALLLLSIPSCRTKPEPKLKEPVIIESRGYSEGLALKKEGNRWGYLNEKMELLIPIKFDEAHDFNYGIALVREGDSKGYINQKGKYINYKPCQYENEEDGLNLREYYLQELEYSTTLTRDAFVYLMHPQDVSGNNDHRAKGWAKAMKSIIASRNRVKNFDRDVTEIIATLSLVKTEDYSQDIKYFQKLEQLRKTSSAFNKKADRLAETARKTPSKTVTKQVKDQARKQIEKIKKLIKEIKAMGE